MTFLMGSIPLLNCLPMIRLFFSVVQDPNESAKYLSLDLTVVSQRAYQWKMLVNLDPKNPAEVIFSSKKNEETHPSVFYNNIFKSTWV